MSNLAFVNTLASTLSTTSIPMAMMVVTMIMILPGVIVGAYTKAYDAYKSMSSEDQDMLVGMSIISLGMGLVVLFALTNMNILVLLTLAGLAVKEWSNWSGEINEQDEEEILVRTAMVFESNFDFAMWVESTKININSFDDIDVEPEADRFFNAYFGYGSPNYRQLAAYAQKKLVQNYC